MTSTRAQVKEEGANALRRLHLMVHSQHNLESRVAAQFLLSVYDRTKFDFDITGLRVFSPARFLDCLAVLRMDTDSMRQAFRLCLARDGCRLEELVANWSIVEANPRSIDPSLGSFGSRRQRWLWLPRLIPGLLRTYP